MSSELIALFRLLSSQLNATLAPASSAGLPARHAAKKVLKPTRPEPSRSIDSNTSRAALSDAPAAPASAAGAVSLRGRDHPRSPLRRGKTKKQNSRGW